MPIDRDVGYVLTPEEAAAAKRSNPSVLTGSETVNLSNGSGQVVELATQVMPGIPMGIPAEFPGPGRGWGQHSNIGSGNVRMGPVDGFPDSPPMGELGTAWPRERYFSYFEGGVVFESGPRYAEEYNRMLRHDGKARSLEQALTLPIRSLSWHLEGAKGDKGEHDLISEMVTTPPEGGGMQVPFSDVIAQMTGAFLFRRAHFEKVWKIRPDGKAVYDYLAWRDPSTCYLGLTASDARFAGIMQWTWKGFAFERILIPALKSFVYIHNKHRNPLTGVSDLETAYTIWDAKQKIRFLWYSFLENFSLPKAWVTEPTGDEGRAASLAKKVAQLKGGGVVTLAADEVVHPFESTQHAPGEFQAAINYLDSEMRESLLAGFLDLTGSASGSSTGRGHGSFALSSDATQFFRQAREGASNEIAEAITYGIFRDACVYNFGPEAKVPKFVFSPVQASTSIDAAISFLQSIAAIPERFPGAIPMIPDEFVDLLTERVAGYLDLDVDAVHKSLVNAHDIRPAPPGLSENGAKAVGAVNQAASMVAGAQNGNARVGPGPSPFVDTRSYAGQSGDRPG